MPSVIAGGHRLEYEWFGDMGSARECVVMLHEGLGSLSLWQDFPKRLALSTGRGVLAYSRYGYGRSDPIKGPRTVDFMHTEALTILPQLLFCFPHMAKGGFCIGNPGYDAPCKRSGI